jgi:adsorption protein B
MAALAPVAASDSGVHICPCPHDGPTSKADCLNWIYQHLLMREGEAGIQYEAIVMHDAEDLIHPDALTAMDAGLVTHDMVQVPVLPLATPISQWTHGVYCDEFAESQFKDLRARVFAGGFLPSCGVGTALSRTVVEELAKQNANRVFEPECLTEDYELGLRIHRMGRRQLLTPLDAIPPIATREFFPHRAASAIRQRTRWITGIALQGWQRNGWSHGWQNYWLWRHRKALLGNPLTLAANAVFLYGVLTAAVSPLLGVRWTLGDVMPWAAWAGLTLQAFRLATRSACTARFYGPWFALGVPIRVFWANWINFRATMAALHVYFRSRLTRTPLVWLKTEHAFPSLAALHRETASATPPAEVMEPQIGCGAARPSPASLSYPVSVPDAPLPGAGSAGNSRLAP